MPGKAEAGGFAGLYTYDVRIYNGKSFPRMCASARMHNLLCAPSVGPGFDSERATGDTRIQGRANGKTYDRMWRGAIRAAADVVTITSYNEWHEGTQIEPASAIGAPYASYDGAYGLTGRAAQRAYLDRTAAWVRAYREKIGRSSRSSVTRPLVERRGQPAAIRADERIFGIESLEQRHRDLAQPVALVRPCSRHGADDELKRTFGVTRVERRDDVG